MTEQTTTDETTDGLSTTAEVTVDETETEVDEDTTTETEATEPETFPREYVQKLRDESAKYRQRASDRDTLAERLHVALVAATGRLADPTDLSYSEDHLEDPDALTAAIDDLVTKKPHLASRTPRGDVGQGVTGGGNDVDLAGLLRRNAS